MVEMLEQMPKKPGGFLGGKQLNLLQTFYE